MKHSFLRTHGQATALLVTLAGAAIPWIRLAIRGHVEFCDDDCNARDWLDHAETIGALLSMAVPAAMTCSLAFRACRSDERHGKPFAGWMFLLLAVIASTLCLAQLRQAYFDQF